MFIINSPPNSATTRWFLTARTSRWGIWRGRSWAGRSSEPGTATCRSQTGKLRKVRHNVWFKKKKKECVWTLEVNTWSRFDSWERGCVTSLSRGGVQKSQTLTKRVKWMGATFLLHSRLMPFIKRPDCGGSAVACREPQCEMCGIKIAKVGCEYSQVMSVRFMSSLTHTHTCRKNISIGIHIGCNTSR